MTKLKNVYLEDLNDNALHNLLLNLGCDIEYPKLISNKYINKDNVSPKGLSEKYIKEQKKCNYVNRKRIDKYEKDVYNWLMEHNYIEEVED